MDGNLIDFTPHPRCAAEDDLHAYVDGLLNPAERARVEACLSASPAERVRVEAYRRQNVLMHGLYDGVEQRPLPEGCGFLAGRLAGVMRRQRRFAHARRAAVAASVALLAVVAGWTGYERYTQPDNPLVAFTRQAIDAHAMLLGDRAPGQGLLQPVGKDRGVFEGLSALPDSVPRRAPDLGKHGLSLIGARVIRGEQNTALQLLYGDGKERRVTLFMGPSWSDHKSASSLVEDGGITLIYWQLGPVGFSLIGNVGRAAILELASKVSESLTAKNPEAGRPGPMPTAPKSAPRLAPAGSPDAPSRLPEGREASPPDTPIKASNPST